MHIPSSCGVVLFTFVWISYLIIVLYNILSCFLWYQSDYLYIQYEQLY